MKQSERWMEEGKTGKTGKTGNTAKQPGITDSHAHLCSRQLFPRWEEVVREARKAGIEKILIVCTEVEEARKAIRMAEGDPMFDVAAAFYPNDILKVTDRDWEEMEQVIRSPQIKVVGEIGMDYYPYDNPVPKEMQKQAFIRQMRLANELGQPVSIHMRLATEDTRSYMKEYLRVPGIMHCYSGGYRAMGDFLDMGMYISFSGNITFELEDEETQRAVREVPMDRILIETDAPSLTPAPVQDRENEPKYITHVIDHICRLRGIERETLIRASSENYKRLIEKGR